MVMAETVTVTVNDVLDGHVALDVECLDRVYLNGYVPCLQVGGQVVTFMTRHLGYRIPSPAILERIGIGTTIAGIAGLVLVALVAAAAHLGARRSSQQRHEVTDSG